jgi:hypothetical protein
MAAELAEAKRRLATNRFVDIVDEGVVLTLALLQASHDLQEADDDALLTDLHEAIGALETVVDARLRSSGVKR